MPLLAVRSLSARAGLSGSPAMSAALTSRCAPLSTLVTTIAARRAARSVLSAVRMSSFIVQTFYLECRQSRATATATTVHPSRAAARPSRHDGLLLLHFLDEHPDGAAAR